MHQIIEAFDRGGLLSSSSDGPATRPESAFVSPVATCIESASCTGPLKEVSLQLGDDLRLRVVSSSRRLAMRLKRSLAPITDRDPAPLGFLMRRNRRAGRYELVDRGGFVLGSAPTGDGVVDMTVSHIAALMPPAADHVRFRCRGVLREGRVHLVGWPLLFSAPFDEGTLAATGIRLLDRLVVDIDPGTMTLAAASKPVPRLRALRVAPGHASVFEDGYPVGGLVVPEVPGTRPPRLAAAVAGLAGELLAGSRAAALDLLLAAAQQPGGITPVDPQLPFEVP